MSVGLEGDIWRLQASPDGGQPGRPPRAYDSRGPKFFRICNIFIHVIFIYLHICVETKIRSTYKLRLA